MFLTPVGLQVGDINASQMVKISLSLVTVGSKVTAAKGAPIVQCMSNHWQLYMISVFARKRSDDKPAPDLRVAKILAHHAESTGSQKHEELLSIRNSIQCKEPRDKTPYPHEWNWEGREGKQPRNAHTDVGRSLP